MCIHRRDSCRDGFQVGFPAAKRLVLLSNSGTELTVCHGEGRAAALPAALSTKSPGPSTAIARQASASARPTATAGGPACAIDKNTPQHQKGRRAGAQTAQSGEGHAAVQHGPTLGTSRALPSGPVTVTYENTGPFKAMTINDMRRARHAVGMPVAVAGSTAPAACPETSQDDSAHVCWCPILVAALA